MEGAVEQATRGTKSHLKLENHSNSQNDKMEEIAELLNTSMALINIGIYFVDLKTLICWPEARSNLDAIVYMTRTGLLVPLEEMTLYGSENIQMSIDVSW